MAGRVMRRLMGVLVGVALALSGCTSESPTATTDSSTSQPVFSSPAEPSSPASTQSSEAPVVIDYQAAVDTALQEFVADAQGGATVAVSYNGDAAILSAAGPADVAGAELLPDSLFRAGSITKPFIAVIVMQLVQEGQVDLDAPVTGYLPDVTVANGATVRQLLNHSSGIPNYTDAAFAAVTVAEPGKVWTPPLILDHIASVPAVFAAGERNEYSNTNYVILGLLIEKLTGLSASQNLADRITGPLGLTNTYLAPEADRQPVTGFGAELPGGSTEGVEYTSIETAAWTAGALVSTASDLLTFLQALAGGKLVDATSLAQMTDFSTPDGYGLGLFMMPMPGGDGFGHDGSIPGFFSLFAIEPVSGTAFVILGNDSALYLNDLAVQLLQYA